MTLKKRPEDFEVEELLQPQLWNGVSDRPGPFALYRLVKTSLTTTMALTMAARALGVRPGAFSYAGLKDRHARTTQYVTLQGGEGQAPKEISDRGWSLERLGWLERPLQAGDIAANRFRLVLRDLSSESCQCMDERIGLFTAGPGRILFVNYFGDQRFGSARVEFLARLLIRGEYQEALRIFLTVTERKERKALKDFKRQVAENWGNWPLLSEKLPSRPERAPIEHLAKAPDDFRGAFTRLPYFVQFMQVEAYQSWLWNRTAAEFIATSGCRKIRAIDRFGELVFAPASELKTFSNLQLPVFGPKSRLEDPWRKAAQKILDSEGFSLQELRLPGLRRPAFREKWRPLLAEARDFVAEEAVPQPGGGFSREIRFVLPRGAYATVLLRALGH